MIETRKGSCAIKHFAGMSAQSNKRPFVGGYTQLVNSEHHDTAIVIPFGLLSCLVSVDGVEWCILRHGRARAITVDPTITL